MWISKFPIVCQKLNFFVTFTFLFLNTLTANCNLLAMDDPTINQITDFFLVKRFDDAFNLCKDRLNTLSLEFGIDDIIPNFDVDLTKNTTNVKPNYSDLLSVIDFYHVSTPYICLLVQILFEIGRKDEIMPAINHIYMDQWRMIPFDVLFIIVNFQIKKFKNYKIATKLIKIGLEKPVIDYPNVNSSLISSTNSNEALNESISVDDYLKMFQVYIFHVLAKQKKFDDAKEKIMNDKIVEEKDLKSKYLEHLEELRNKDIKKKLVNSNKNNNSNMNPSMKQKTSFTHHPNIIPGDFITPKDLIEPTAASSEEQTPNESIEKDSGINLASLIKRKWSEYRMLFIKYLKSMNNNKEKLISIFILALGIITLIIKFKRSKNQIIERAKLTFSRLIHEFKMMAFEGGFQ